MSNKIYIQVIARVDGDLCGNDCPWRSKTSRWRCKLFDVNLKTLNRVEKKKLDIHPNKIVPLRYEGCIINSELEDYSDEPSVYEEN